MVCNYTREGGFPRSRRAPEYQGGELVVLDQMAQSPIRAEKMLLAAYFVQGCRTHPFRQRGVVVSAGIAEKIHTLYL
jgi:hypothetical protein